MSPHALRGLLAYLMGDNPECRVYLSEDAPTSFARAVNDAVDSSSVPVVPWVDPAAKETP